MLSFCAHVHTPTHTSTHTHTLTCMNKNWQLYAKLDIHHFSLVIFGNLGPQTDSAYRPLWTVFYSTECMWVCVHVCVYPASSSSCVSNSSLSCRLMTELKERDSNMDRCLTPFSPDLETTGQTSLKHTHTNTHTCIAPIFGSFSFVCKGDTKRKTYRSKEVKRGGTSFTLYIRPACFSLFPWQQDPTHNHRTSYHQDSHDRICTHTHSNKVKHTLSFGVQEGAGGHISWACMGV